MVDRDCCCELGVRGNGCVIGSPDESTAPFVVSVRLPLPGAASSSVDEDEGDDEKKGFGRSCSPNRRLFGVVNASIDGSKLYRRHIGTT